MPPPLDFFIITEDMKKLFMALLLLPAAMASQAAEIEYTYNRQGVGVRGYGFERAETYDVAILIDEPSLRGAVIKEIRVALPDAGNISAVSGWLTTELKLKRKSGKPVNDPDIATAPGSVDHGVLKVSFPTPHTIDGPLYAGYSFTVDKLTDASAAPVTVAGTPASGGLFIHSSASCLKWSENSEAAAGVSVMKVIVEGDFKDNAASALSRAKLIGSADAEENPVSILIANHGMNEVTSLEYTWSIAGNKGSGVFTPVQPLPAVWGASAELNLDLGGISTAGLQELSFTIDKVNGIDNTDIASTVLLPIMVYPFIPVNRPLVEEYTGLWCGYCPKGYVALETMREEYPGQFIGLAYHSGDAMAGDFHRPNSPSSFPAAFINRESNINPEDLYTLWPEAAKSLAPASVDVDVEWADEAHSAITATARVRFIEDDDAAAYSLSYALVADGLTDPQWKQQNNYSGAVGNPEIPGKWGELFSKGGRVVTGLIFNDVVMAVHENKGIPGSVPRKLSAGQTVTHSHTFALPELGALQELAGKNKDNLRVVAILIDSKSGRSLPVNCNSSRIVGNYAGVGEVSTDEVVKTLWYDLSGRRLQAPAPGLMIKVEQLRSGRTRVTKAAIPVL